MDKGRDIKDAVGKEVELAEGAAAVSLTPDGMVNVRMPVEQFVGALGDQLEALFEVVGAEPFPKCSVLKGPRPVDPCMLLRYVDPCKRLGLIDVCKFRDWIYRCDVRWVRIDNPIGPIGCKDMYLGLDKIGQLRDIGILTQEYFTQEEFNIINQIQIR